MARIEDGVWAAFRGKVGGMVGSRWKKTKYIRSKGSSTRKNNSPAQIEHQAKFALAISFVSRMKKLFRITYRNYSEVMTARNAAVSDLVNNAITGIYPNFTIDYSKVRISRGSLDNELPDRIALSVAAGILKWTWSFDVAVSPEDANHRTILVAYCPSIDRSLYLVQGPARSTNTATLNVASFMGKSVVTWLAFITEDGTMISDSEYTGQIVVA